MHKLLFLFTILITYSCANPSDDSICNNNPCKELNRTVCSVKSGTYQCLCDAGYIDKYGICTIDTTNNPCNPNPCTTEHRTICNGDNEIPICLCDDNYHDENNLCVKDPLNCNENEHEENGICVINSLNCNENEHEENSQCISNTKTVNCISITPPVNAILNNEEVEIIWNNGSWSEAANCSWSCNTGFHITADALSCEENVLVCNDDEHEELGGCVSNTKMVDCINNTPSTGINVDQQVEVIWINGNWETASNCEWYCNPNYEKTDSGCVIIGNPGAVCNSGSECYGESTFCADYTQAGYCSSSCVRDGDLCMTTGVCSAGVCYKTCTVGNDSSCERSDLICINGENNIGGVCRLKCYDNNECTSGYCSSSGHCEINYTTCNFDEVNNSGCSLNNTCFDDNGSTYCYPNNGKINGESCDDLRDCIAQYSCLGNPTDGYTCQELCRSGTDCSNGPPICSSVLSGENYGYCLFNYVSCNPDPVNNTGCLSDEICFDDGGSYCHPSMGKINGEVCEYSNDCIAGYGCIGNTTDGYKCTEYCRSISDCTSGGTCTLFGGENYGYCN
jgi:hypothetical protein